MLKKISCLVLSLIFSIISFRFNSDDLITTQVSAVNEVLSNSQTTDFNTYNDVSWSLFTLDGDSINQSTYAGNTVILVFYRGDRQCGNSNGMINSLSKSAWIKNDDVTVIAVESNNTDSDTIREFKNQFAPDCNDIIFAYGDDASQMLWSYLSNTIDASSVAFTINVIIDSDNNIRYCLQGSRNVLPIQDALSRILPDINTSSEHTIDINGIFDYDEAAEVFAQLNSLRTGLGLPELTMDADLTYAAMQRAVEASVSFSHTRPNGNSFSEIISGSYTSAGENLAMGQDSAKSVMDSWINSPGHYGNMISEQYTAAGIGCFYQENGRKYWAQLFTGGMQPTPVTDTGKTVQTNSVSIVPENLTIVLSQSDFTIKPGETKTIALLSLENSSYSIQNQTEIVPSFYESDDTGVAVIDADGVVTGVGEGRTIVKLGINENYYAQCTVTVTGSSDTSGDSDNQYEDDLETPVGTSNNNISESDYLKLANASYGEVVILDTSNAVKLDEINVSDIKRNGLTVVVDTGDADMIIAANGINNILGGLDIKTTISKGSKKAISAPSSLVNSIKASLPAIEIKVGSGADIQYYTAEVKLDVGESVAGQSAVVLKWDEYTETFDFVSINNINADGTTNTVISGTGEYIVVAGITGDVDKDGKVTAKDVTNLLKSLTGMIELDPLQNVLANPKTGKPTSASAVIILQYLTGLIDKI